jgi:hypothetical protein
LSGKEQGSYQIPRRSKIGFFVARQFTGDTITLALPVHSSVTGRRRRVNDRAFFIATHHRIVVSSRCACAQVESPDVIWRKSPGGSIP